jgi:hypothetical protein
MKTVANRPEYKPTWLYTEVLDRLWKESGSPYVASWTGLPRFPEWFEYENGHLAAFKTADLYIEMLNGAARIEFLDGRHRRWLMNRFELVPVGLEERHYEEALRLGLASRRVLADDRFRTF